MFYLLDSTGVQGPDSGTKNYYWSFAICLWFINLKLLLYCYYCWFLSLYW